MERTPSDLNNNSVPLTPLTARPKTTIDVNFFSQGSALDISFRLSVFIFARLGQLCNTSTSCIGGTEFKR